MSAELKMKVDLLTFIAQAEREQNVKRC